MNDSSVTFLSCRPIEITSGQKRFVLAVAFALLSGALAPPQICGSSGLMAQEAEEGPGDDEKPDDANPFADDPADDEAEGKGEESEGESEDAKPDEDKAAPVADLETELAKWREYFVEGNYRRSGQLIGRLVKEHPASIEVGLASVRQSWMVGAYRKAGRLLDDLIDANPGNHVVRRAEARHQIMVGEYETAEATLRELALADTNDLESRYVLARLLDTELGKRSEARDLFGTFYDWWNALSPEAAQELGAEQILYLGMACWGYGDPHVALQKMDEAAKKDPLLIEALIAQGDILLEKYNKPGAKRDGYEPALQLNANHPDALCGIAALHLAEFGQIDEAEAQLKKALRVNANHINALLLSAAARLDSQDYESARRMVASALVVNPRSIDALSMQGAIAMLASDDAEFERIEKQVAERAPAAASRLYAAVADALAGRHRYPEAVNFGRKAVEADERNAAAYVSLGINMTRSGDQWEAGKAILEEAYERDSFNVQVYNFLKLLDEYGKNYTFLETEHLRIILHKKDKQVIGHDLAAILEEAWDVLTVKYKCTPPTPVVIEMLPEHQDFSVRSVGVTGLGALGVCFGRVVTLLGPEGMKGQDQAGNEQIQRFNWGQTAWHEFAHVITLAKTGSRIPRWFTEGLSVFEEKERRPEWCRELEIPVNDALESGSLRPIVDLNEGFTRGEEIMLSYYVGSMVCEFVRDEFGFDRILEMLDLYAKDLTTTEVIKQSFGFEPEEFDRRFKDYLRDAFSEYSLTPTYTRDNIRTWRDELAAKPGGVEEIVLAGKLALAYWSNKSVADAELSAVKAINLYEAMIAEGPNATEEARLAASWGHIVLARMFHQRARPEKAKEHFDKAFALGSDDYFAHRMRAEIAQAEEDSKTAISEYEAALESFPRLASPPDSVYRRLYELYRDEGEDEKAISILEAFCRIDNSDIAVRKLLASHYKETSQDEKLLEILTQARLITCTDADVNSMLASAAPTGRDPATRMRQIKASLAVSGLEDGDRVRLLVDLAEAQLEAGEVIEALDSAEDALALDSSYFRGEKVASEIEAKVAADPVTAREVRKRRLERRVNDVNLESEVRLATHLEYARLLIEEDELYDAREILERAQELPIVSAEVDELMAEIDKALEHEERGEDE